MVLKLGNWDVPTRESWASCSFEDWGQKKRQQRNPRNTFTGGVEGSFSRHAPPAVRIWEAPQGALLGFPQPGNCKKSYCDPLPGCNHETEVCHSGILKGFQAAGSPAETHMGHIIPRSRQQAKPVKRKAPSAPAMNLSAFPLTQQCSSNSAGEFWELLH